MGTLYSTYVKTPKGIEEVERKVHGLALKSRQVLIMIDGKRDFAVLQGIFPPEMVPGILDELIAGGYIRELEKPKPAPAATGAGGDEEDPFILSQTFMINIAKRLLGIAGDGVIAKLKSANDLDALRALFPEWRNAIKQNPDGLQRMKEFETKLFHVLGEVSAQPGAAASPAKPKASAPAPAAAVRPADDDERLSMARTFMINTTSTFIGMAGSALIDKVERAASITELRHLYYDWKESMQLDKEGKKRLPDLEKRLAALLS